MKSIYESEVRNKLESSKNDAAEILTEEDIRHLPVIVQKYLHYTGVTGREKVQNFRAEFKGGIRGRSNEKYMPLRSVQYNFMGNPVRLFYIVARKAGIPVKGIHIYKNAKAYMKIKLFGLLTVVDAKGKEMDQGETVTVFNDMCLMAPASLIDKNISWEVIDALTVKAKFTNGNINIGATLYFNVDGRLLNFISDDRYEYLDGRYTNYPWETPISEYIELNGFRLPSKAKLIYRHPTEDFCYAEFEMTNIEYNCRDLK